LTFECGRLHQSEILPILLLLNRAKQLPHGKSTLYEHLTGTYSILAAWNCPTIIQKFGLLHSVYSTQHYPHGVLSLECRQHLVDIAGVEVERLVYIFCTIERRELWANVSYSKIPSSVRVKLHASDNFVTLDEDIIRSIAFVEVANAVEQSYAKSGLPGVWMYEALDSLCRLEFPHGIATSNELSRWSEEMENEACLYYREFLESGGREMELLRRALENNPFSGELHFLVGIEAVLRGQFDKAEALTRRAEKLLRAWGSAWDRRLGLREWLEIVNLARNCSLSERKDLSDQFFSVLCRNYHKA